jgi:hypothetical protein
MYQLPIVDQLATPDHGLSQYLLFVSDPMGCQFEPYVADVAPTAP